MGGRLFAELERDPRAIGAFQRIQDAAMAVRKVLVQNLKFAVDGNVLACCDLRLSGGVVAVLRHGWRSDEKRRQNRLAEDPRGTDPDSHGGTFLTAMIVMSLGQSEITEVQSQLDISEVLRPSGLLAPGWLGGRREFGGGPDGGKVSSGDGATPSPAEARTVSPRAE